MDKPHKPFGKRSAYAHTALSPDCPADSGGRKRSAIIVLTTLGVLGGAGLLYHGTGAGSAYNNAIDVPGAAAGAALAQGAEKNQEQPRSGGGYSGFWLFGSSGSSAAAAPPAAGQRPVANAAAHAGGFGSTGAVHASAGG